MPQLLALLSQHGVLVVFAITLMSRIGLPLPVSPLLVIVGGFAATGVVSWPAAYAIAVAAVVANTAGAEAWFLAGRRYGYRVMRFLCRISVSPDSCVRQSESLLGRWGGSSLLASPFIPGLATLIAPMAGALRMTQRRFLFFQAAGSVLWVAAYMVLGIVFSTQIAQAIDVMQDAGVAATIVVVALLLVWLGMRYWVRRRTLKDLAMPRIAPEALRDLMRSDTPPVVIDVRGETGRQVDPRMIAGALALDFKTLHGAMAHLPRDRRIVVYCNCPNDVSAARAARYLTTHGFRDALPLAGGLDAWLTLTGPALASERPAERAPVSRAEPSAS